jgi:hypothetical protein
MILNMNKKILITFLLLVISQAPLFAKKVNYSIGACGGFAPSLGGNMDSVTQQNLGSNAGMDGMNRSMEDVETKNIDRLFGLTGGFEFKTIFQDFFLVRLGANFSSGVFGGGGKTVIPYGADYYSMECKYSFFEFDVPLTIGLAIPFWKDMMFSLSCGTAYAYAKYKNEFVSEDAYPAPFELKGNFNGWGFPMVVIIQGEYFFLTNASLTSTISYYNGTTEVLKDSYDDDGDVDFTTIDFTGYRFTFGISYYFYSI